MRSLRLTLLIGTGVATTLLVAVSSVVTWWLVRASLYSEFDRLLAAKGRSLAALVEQERKGVEVEFAEHALPEFEPSTNSEYFQLWQADGTIIARSKSLAGGDLKRIVVDGDEPVFESTALPDGRPGRLVAIAFHPRPEKNAESSSAPVTLVVGRDVTAIEKTLTTLSMVLVAVSGATVLLILGSLMFVIHRAVAPVRRLASGIAAIDEATLGMRFDNRETPAELRPVVTRLNELLARLAVVIDREKSFSADVAHELRTPLAGLRTTIDVALSRQRTAPAYREALEMCQRICTSTQGVIDTLLSLVKPGTGLRRETIDLAELLRSHWQMVEERARERRIVDDWNIVDRLTVQSDPGRLAMIVGNLLENAVEHADVGGSIRIETSLQDQSVQIHIANTGSRVASDDVHRVFEAFWRGDASRTGTERHAGLGLSLCRKLADSIGGTLTVESTAGGEFRITVQLPRELPDG